MKNAIFPPALDVQFYHAACSIKQVMGGVHAHSVDDRQEAGQQLEGACEQEATVIGGLVEGAVRLCTAHSRMVVLSADARGQCLVMVFSFPPDGVLYTTVWWFCQRMLLVGKAW